MRLLFLLLLIGTFCEGQISLAAPSAPYPATTDDVANTLTVALNPSFTLGDHEYSLNSGNAWTTMTVNPIQIGNVAISAGAILVRVKALNGNPAGYATNASADFTVSAGTAPAAPTAGVVDDVADTYNWTNNPSFTALSDYEYSLNSGASYTTVTAKPIVVGNVAKAINEVRVRVKAVGINPPSTHLGNSAAFTVSGGGTAPAAPTAGVVDDVADTYNWTNNPSFTGLSDYEYTLNAGTSFAIVIAKPIVVGNTAKAIGQVGVRVKSVGINPPSAVLYNATAFTVSGGGVAPGPPYPAITDDVANTLTVTLNSSFALGDHEYSLNSGNTWTTMTVNPIQIGNIALGAGNILVRVKALNGNPSGNVTNASADFTVSGGGGGGTAPAAPTSAVVDNTNDTYNWTNNPSFTALSDYEYTFNSGASYSIVTAKPIVVGNQAKGVGEVGVRVKAIGSNPASTTLYNGTAFTASGSGPAAPTNLYINDILDYVFWDNNPGYATNDHEISLDGGNTYNPPTSKPMYVGDVYIPVGNLRIRVKALGGNPAGAYASNPAAFTVVPNATPAPPTNPVVNDVDNTFRFRPSSSYTPLDYEYSINGGAYQAMSAPAGIFEYSLKGTNPTKFGFLQYTPGGYNPSSGKYWPVIIFLHGGTYEEVDGSTTAQLDKLRTQGINQRMTDGRHFPALVISPQWGYNSASDWNATDVCALMNYIKTNYRVDPNKIYVTGLSIGGGGTWDVANLCPVDIAGIVPIASGKWYGILSVNAANIYANDIPLWEHHSQGDGNAPAWKLEQWLNSLGSSLGSTNQVRDGNLSPNITKTAHGRVGQTWEWLDGTSPLNASGGVYPKQIHYTLTPDDSHDNWTRVYYNEDVWHWLFEKINNGGAFVPETFTINVGNVNIAIGQLKVRVRAHTKRNVSADLTNTIAFTGSGNGTVASPNTPVENCNIPVNLLGEAIEEDALLNWQIPLSNIHHFNIQHSTDGVNFTTIDTSNAKNEKPFESYHFVHLKPASQDNHYRLQIVNKNGSTYLSNVVFVKVEKKITTLTVYPNPVQNELHFQTSGDATAVLQMIDATGKLIRNEYLEIRGTMTTTLNVSNLSKGMYYLILNKQGKLMSAKFIKQ